MQVDTENSTAVGPIVTLTGAAVKQIKRQMTRTGNEGKLLRLGVRGGGCSGLSYVIDFDEETDERDQTWEVDGLRVAVDAKSARYLSGTTIDYSIKNLMEGGFVFDNPNAARSCGCGTSFTAK